MERTVGVWEAQRPGHFREMLRDTARPRGELGNPQLSVCKSLS